MNGSPLSATTRRVFVGSVLFVLVTLTAQAQVTPTIRVADGDVAGLRAAITALNLDGGGTIELAPNGSYVPAEPVDWWYGPNAFPAIASTITIEGRGATIERLPAASKFRFFFVSGGYSGQPAGALTLRDLTLKGGLARGGDGGAGLMSGGGAAGFGGAIYNQGTVTLNEVTLADNIARGGDGRSCCHGAGGGGGLGGNGGDAYQNAEAASGGGFRGYGIGTRFDIVPPGFVGGYGGDFTGPEGGISRTAGGAGGTSSFGGNGSSGEADGGAGGGGGGFAPGSNAYPPIKLRDRGCVGTSSPFFCPGGLGGIGGGRGGAGIGRQSVGAGGGAFGGGGGSSEDLSGAGGGGVGGGGGGDYFSFAGAGGFGGGGGGGCIGGDGGFGGGAGASDCGNPVYPGWGGGGAALGASGGGGGFGGAIFNHKGTLIVVASTMRSNHAIGGSASNSGGGFGGAIFNLNGTVTLAFSTTPDNSADTGSGDEGPGQAFYNLSHNGGNVTATDIAEALLTLIATPLETSNNALVSTTIDGSATVLDGVEPHLVLSTKQVAFPGQILNTTSDPQHLTIRNLGTAPLVVESVSADGEFAQATNCDIVAPGASCTVDITFHPTATQLRSGTLRLESNDLDHPRAIALTGRGGLPSVSFAPASLEFREPVGTSRTKRVVLTNDGQDELHVTSVSVDSPFTATSTCAVIAPNMSCDIDVTFAPAIEASHSQMLSVVDDASGSPHTVPLSAAGLVPIASIEPASLDFLPQPLGIPVSLPLTIANTGQAPLHISALTSSAPQFAASGCTTIEAGATCDVMVTFVATASSPVSATLSIADNEVGSPRTVPLSGSGVAPAASVSPGAVAFGDSPLYNRPMQTVTVTNDGPGLLTVFGVSAGSPYDVWSDCGTLPVHGACTVYVQLDGYIPGPSQVMLNIATNAVEGTLRVPLSGNVIFPSASVTPLSLDFGTMRRGGSTPPQVVVLENHGPGQLAVSSVDIPAGYSQTNTCSGAIAVGATCQVSVQFRPVTTGAIGGTLRINANTHPPLEVQLSGTATVPIAPTVTLASSANPALMGEEIALTAAVTGPGAIATGNVIFEDAGRPIGTVPLTADGHATLTIGSLGVGPHQLTVFYGGDTRFLPAATSLATVSEVGVLSMPGHLASGDFNGDGQPDVVGRTGFESDDSYCLFYDFQACNAPDLMSITNGVLRSSNVPGLSWQVAAADFDGDGRSDVAYGVGSDIFVAHGAPAGLDHNAVLAGSTSQYSSGSLAATDFDGDGKQDLIAAGGTNIVLMRGRGDGTFRPAQALASYDFYDYLAVIATGDFNHDGTGDVAVKGHYFGGILVIFGGPAPHSVLLGELGGLQDLASGDFDGDGKDDLIGASTYPPFLAFFRSLGESFAAPVIIPLATLPKNFAVADVNQDGHLDVVVNSSSNGVITPLLGDGTGAFTIDADTTLFPPWWNLEWLLASPPRVGTPVRIFAGVGLPALVTLMPIGAASLTQTIEPASVTMSLTATPAQPAAGDDVTLAASLPVTAPGGGSPDGTVTFYDNGQELGTIPAAGGAASFKTTLMYGTHNLTASYSGAPGYSSAASAMTLFVTRATPVISWTPSSAALTYPARIGAAHLNAVTARPIAGHFVYKDQHGLEIHDGDLLNANDYAVNATFWPDDVANYDPSQPALAIIAVEQGEQTITWNNPAPVPFGTPLNASVFNATVSVTGPDPAGTLLYFQQVGALLPGGTQTLTVRAEPTRNYKVATKTVTIEILKADQTITWSNPAPMTYGQRLSSVQLHPTVTTLPGTSPGAMTFTPPLNTLLPAGTHTLKVDVAATENYNSSSASVTVRVDPAPLDVFVQASGRGVYDPVQTYPAEIFWPASGAQFGVTFSTTAGAGAPAGAYQLVPIFNDPSNARNNYAINYPLGLAFTVWNPDLNVTSVEPTMAVKGAGATTVTIRAASCRTFGGGPESCGYGFVPRSFVKWNDIALVTTFVSRNELRAVVPAALLAERGVGYLTTASPDPFMGTPVVREFFVVDTPTTVESVATSTGNGDGALVIEAGSTGEGVPNTVFLESDAAGAGTITLATYAGNPGAAFSGGDDFFGVFVAPGSTFQSLTIKTCAIGAAHQVFWFSNTGWRVASNQTYMAATPESPACISVLVSTAGTSPLISELGGTFFAVANAPPTTASPDGRMFGMGHLDVGTAHHHFAFRVSQRSSQDTGRLEYWVTGPKKNGKRDDDDDDYGADDDGDHDCYGRAHKKSVSTFEATTITSVVFLDDPAFKPGAKKPKNQPTVDSVTINGTGRWNGKAGYTFEAHGTDQGEPGRNRDTFSIVVKDARGVVVANVSSSLDGGNIQSTRLKK